MNFRLSVPFGENSEYSRWRRLDEWAHLGQKASIIIHDLCTQTKDPMLIIPLEHRFRSRSCSSWSKIESNTATLETSSKAVLGRSISKEMPIVDPRAHQVCWTFAEDLSRGSSCYFFLLQQHAYEAALPVNIMVNGIWVHRCPYKTINTIGDTARITLHRIFQSCISIFTGLMLNSLLDPDLMISTDQINKTAPS